MIARSPPRIVDAPWRAAYRVAYRDPAALLADLGLSTEIADHTVTENNGFPFRVTREFASRMTPGDANDPLLLQVLPRSQEATSVAGFVADPVGELSGPADGRLIHKYHGRALLVTTGACAIHCRYCFRREYPYARSSGAAELDRALVRIEDDENVSEVILSGGDPLMLDNAVLAPIFDRLNKIPHVKRLRIHTRLPIVLPQRIDPELVDILTGSANATPVIVVHTNHAKEIDLQVGNAFALLRAAGVTTLNQSVLLRNINDDAETLCTLSERLFDHGVLPYYLHQLDRVSGSAHFETPDPRALQIETELRRRLPGYLVPRLVREIPGRPAKQPLL